MTEPKFMNFIRRLIRENFYFSNQSCQIWWQIGRMNVMKNTKYQQWCMVHARPKTIVTWGENTTTNIDFQT